LSWHKALKEVKEKTDFTIALAGNPNVGKSCIFNQLTGLSVVTANYPGKTVELNFGVTTHNGLKIGIIDLPGTYALGAVSDDQWVARRGVLEGQPDVVVVVVDASNLQRNLYMVLQFLELDLPVIIALNLIDYAAKIGLKIDYEKLSKLLGTPVIPTVAIRGEGIDELIHAITDFVKEKKKVEKPKIAYGQDIEEAIRTLEEMIHKSSVEIPYNLSARALAIQLLEGDKEFIDSVARQQVQGQGHGHGMRHRRGQRWGQTSGNEVVQLAANLSRQIEERHGEPVGIRIARERHGLAGTIADEVQSKIDTPILFSEKLKHLTVAPTTGIPLMILAILGIFAFIFYVGGFLSYLVNSFWSSLVSPAMVGFVNSLFGSGIISNVILWMIDKGVLAWLSVGVPYIITFYLVLSVIEDSGYLNSIAFLSDNIMHKFGLHGRAIIPILTGAGCNVPAIMGTRVLTTKRERILASALIVLVPCSARTAVILGAVANFIGWTYAVLIFLIELGLIAIVGWGLHKILPGESSGLVMEMFPFRVPSLSSILKKTWFRFKDFAFVAFPIIMLGSLVLGALYETGYLWAIAMPIGPIIQTLLGLPAVAGICLILGVLRKELTLELLVALAIAQYGSGAQNLLNFMTPLQIFIFALVVTIYIPCIATVAVLGKELGWKNAIILMLFTIVLAILVGGIAYRIIPYLGILR
jgi:ferrous iron transport protein B